MIARNPALPLALLASALLTAPARAADLTGRWAWTVRVQDMDFQRQADFKQAGEKLTGAISGGNLAKTEIQEGSVKSDQVAFVMLREVGGRQLKIRYEGKVSADAIKGKITITIDGEDRVVDWTAKRVKPLTGNWTSTVKGPDGGEVQLRIDLKEEGEKLTGSVTRDEQTYEIREGKIAAGEISFLVVADRDGQELQVRFTGKADGNTIKGKISLKIGDQDREIDWEAMRSAAAG